MNNVKEVIDYESIKKQALEQFRSGKSLTGKGGAFAPLIKQFLEAALQAELEHSTWQDNLMMHRLLIAKTVRSARQ